MAPDLFKIIESDKIAAEFQLISDTDSLCRWIARLPAVGALEDLVASHPPSAELLASRTLKLFETPVAPGYLSEFEPAICCYAYVLSRSLNERTRQALNWIDLNANPSHGWLRRLMNRLLEDASTTKSIAESYAPMKSRTVSLGTTTPVTVVQFSGTTANSTSFDSLTEYWSSEDYRDLKAAA